MRSLHLVILLFSSLITRDSWTQPASNHTSENNQIAEEIRIQHPNHSIASLENIDRFDFLVDPTTNQVIAFESNSNKLISLKANSIYQPYKFFDDMSVVETAGAYYSNNHSVELEVQHQQYPTEEFFYTNTKVAYFNLSFPEKGYQYNAYFKKKYKDIKYLTSAYFHKDHPTQKQIIKFQIPDWLEIELKEINFEGYSIKRTESRKFNSTLITFELNNTDARLTEENAPGPSYIYPHILILAKSYNYQNENFALFNSLQDLYNWYKLLIDQVIDETKSYESIVHELCSSKTHDIDKIKSIYFWIQDNIRYIAFVNGIAGFQPDASQNVFHKKYGDCKGMSNLLKQMLIAAGYDARLAWVGTNYINYDYSTPSLSSDNHMICAVFLEDREIFLDPTENFSNTSFYADRIQGRQVLIENGIEYILKRIPRDSITKNISKSSFYLSVNKDNLEGNVYQTYYGELKSHILNDLITEASDSKEKRLIDILSSRTKDSSITNMHYSDLYNREEPFEIKFESNIENKITQFDNEYYLDFDFSFDRLIDIPSNRKHDYALNNRTNDITEVIVEIPFHFELVNMPPQLIYKSKFISVQLEYTTKDRKIFLNKSIQYPHLIIDKSDFPELRDVNNQIINYIDSSVIIKKK